MVHINKPYGKCFKVCPYSTQATDHNDTRIPGPEKVDHTNTDGGKMVMVGRGGGMWMCVDDLCPYYLGTATTELDYVKTVCGTAVSGTRSIVAGTRYIEF